MYIRIASEHSYLLVHHNQQQHQYHPSSTVDISLSSSSLTVNVQEMTGDQQLHDNHAHCIYSSPRGNFSAPRSNSNCRFPHLRKSFMCMCLYSSTRKTSQQNRTYEPSPLSFFCVIFQQHDEYITPPDNSGNQGTENAIMIYDGPPSCDDVNNNYAVLSEAADASSSGYYRCEGCGDYGDIVNFGILQSWS